MFNGEYIRAVARDAHAERLHQAAMDDLARQATPTPVPTAQGAFLRTLASRQVVLSVVRRLHLPARIAVGQRLRSS